MFTIPMGFSILSILLYLFISVVTYLVYHSVLLPSPYNSLDFGVDSLLHALGYYVILRKLVSQSIKQALMVAALDVRFCVHLVILLTEHLKALT